MKKIHKLAEPRQLIEYRSKPGAVYDGPQFTTVKKSIKIQLLKEQGYLCAYCMTRIKIEDMKVEHFLCQTGNSLEQLNYKNLLGCCNGGEGQKSRNQTCDTKKGSSSILFSPADNMCNIESKIKYSRSGRVSSDDVNFEKQINEILNLNYSRLILNRESALEGAISFLSKKAGTRSKIEIQKVIDIYTTKDANSKFKEYSGYLLYYLNRKLKKAN